MHRFALLFLLGVAVVSTGCPRRREEKRHQTCFTVSDCSAGSLCLRPGDTGMGICVEPEQ